MKKVILEPSTNTHTIEGEDIQVLHTSTEMNTVSMRIPNEKGLVLHGEHGPIVTEAEFVTKILQQELNPITRMLQNSFD